MTICYTTIENYLCHSIVTKTKWGYLNLYKCLLNEKKANLQIIQETKTKDFLHLQTHIE